MKKTLAITAALTSTVLLAVPAHAADNPFAATALSGGYQLAQADMKTMDEKPAMPMDGKAADASCGADKKAGKKMSGKKADGSCGGKKAEASCGASKKKADASCGASRK